MTGAHHAIRAEGLILGRPDDAKPVIEHADLVVRPGECVLIEGPTGAGKTTLLRGLAGLDGVERRAGQLRVGDRTALLGQHIETQLLCSTVGEEVALALCDRRERPAVVAERTRHALARVGLEHLSRREVDVLSAGEKQRTVLAALLALDPEVLLLDEPCSALDQPARRMLAGTLSALARRGTAIVVAEHAPEDLASVCSRRLTLEKGHLRETLAVPPAHSAAPLIERVGEELRVHPGQPVLLEPAKSPGWAPQGLLPIRARERVLVTGPNGAGKSTQLRALALHGAGHLPRSRRARRAPPGDVALVLQEPRRALSARTASDEVAFALVRRGVQPAPCRARVDTLLARFGLLEHANRSPLRLSFGQQHRLALAAALATGPRLLLLDEPFAGLDRAARSSLLSVLADEQRSHGTAIVFASHDRSPLAAWCDRVVDLATPGEELEECP